MQQIQISQFEGAVGFVQAEKPEAPQGSTNEFELHMGIHLCTSLYFICSVTRQYSPGSFAPQALGLRKVGRRMSSEDSNSHCTVGSNKASMAFANCKQKASGIGIKIARDAKTKHCQTPWNWYQSQARLHSSNKIMVSTVVLKTPLDFSWGWNFRSYHHKNTDSAQRPCLVGPQWEELISQEV